MRTISGLLAITILFILITPAHAGNISPGVTDSVEGKNMSPGSTDTATTAASPQQQPHTGGGGSSGSSLVFCESFNNIEASARLEKNLRAGQETSYYFKDGFVNQVTIVGANNEVDIPVRVDILKGTTQCDGAKDIGAYKYFNINAGTQRIQSATFVLKLPGSLGNNVIVKRWNKNAKEWQDVSTTLQSQYNGYNYYQVSTPGFSNFAVLSTQSGGEVAEPVKNPEPNQADPAPQPDVTGSTGDEQPAYNLPQEIPMPVLAIAIAIVGVIVICAFYLFKGS